MVNENNFKIFSLKLTENWAPKVLQENINEVSFLFLFSFFGHFYFILFIYLF